jgi:hypothetical protein
MQTDQVTACAGLFWLQRSLGATMRVLCGRFTQHLSWVEIHDLAGLIGNARNPAPHYNSASTPPIEVLRRRLGEGKIEILFKRQEGEQAAE